MPWKKGYYYRNYKRDGRVITEYIGTGYHAEVAAAQDERDRERRKLEATEHRAMVDRDRQQFKALAEVDELIRALTAAVMLTNGYHTHKRQWRKASNR